MAVSYTHQLYQNKIEDEVCLIVILIRGCVGGLGRPFIQADSGFWDLWVYGISLRLLCACGVCFCVAKVLSPGGLLRWHSEQSADGILLALAIGAGCPSA